MAEEQRCQEGLRCANNCGFFGSPTTLNLCSKCYHDHLKADQDLMAVEKSLLAFSSSSSNTALLSSSSFSPEATAVSPAAFSVDPADAAVEGPRRCTACQKRVGLTGFKCRCGLTFCGAHRYPEQHACGFDYKTAGREAIARSNPVVQAVKLHKI